MKYSLIFSFVLGILGLLIGYFLFAGIMGDGFVSIDSIVSFRNQLNTDNNTSDLCYQISKVRVNIILSSGVGAGVGFLLGFVKNKRHN